MGAALFSWLTLLAAPAGAQPLQMPLGFVDLAQVAPAIVVQMRYAGVQNFVGRPVHGYVVPRCLLSRPAAVALARVEHDLAARGLGLMVYDCYRPQRAVDDFVAWANRPGDGADAAARNRHYPDVPKAELFRRGYIALRSGHTRGSTVDLTLIPLSRAPAAGDAFVEPNDCRDAGASASAADGSVEMGTAFDCFDERAHTDHAGLSPQAQRNRRLLREAMVRRGFSPYAKEWWHFTLSAEPFPDRYFDFEVR